MYIIIRITDWNLIFYSTICYVIYTDIDSSSSSLFDIFRFLYTPGNWKPKLFLMLLKLHLIKTQTETENISKLRACTNQLMCWGLAFTFYRFQFLLLNSFFFFSSYNHLNSVIFTIITNQKIFVSKTNLCRSFAGNNILQILS